MRTTGPFNVFAAVLIFSAACSSKANHPQTGDGAAGLGTGGSVGNGDAVGRGGADIGGASLTEDASAAEVTSVPLDGSADGPACGGTFCAANQTCCECGVCINLSTASNCPAACTASSCGSSAAPCQANEICQDLVLLAEGRGFASAKCVPNPCGSQTLDCSCVGSVCQDANAQAHCTLADPIHGTLVCTAVVSVCASPDTPIATPEGNRPIADLKPGDLVYSEHHGALVAVPLLKATRRAAFHHFVVHLVTKTGAELDISAPHPTADGRTFADLKLGDALDGDPIVVREMVPYPYAYTYDILPDSSTGTYLASGLLIGSTLK
jgi:hypothetical protein